MAQTFPRADFDPAALLLAELRRQYSDIALFFHDSLGGDVIGVVWKPEVSRFSDLSRLGGV